ncbi:MAG: phospho-sugar mutase [Spirochaetia bacterium]
MDIESIKSKASNYIEVESEDPFRSEVQELLQNENWEELADRFYTEIEFGTGGLRGVIGGGFNRINPYIVRRASAGMAAYMVEADNANSVVIAHDSRRYAKEFALNTALVFAAYGIKAYLFSGLRPTPELSFAIRELGASGGVVVTASHNPPEYNGYKVYWNDGAQVVAPHDAAIIHKVLEIQGAPRAMSLADAQAAGLLEYIDEDMDVKFVEMVKNNVVRPEVLREYGAAAKVVFTPLHGTGAYLVERALAEFGVQVSTVPEQREPDGEFPTVKSPNPEEGAALEMAIAQGRREQAAIVIGTDPDGDRIGIAVPDGDDFRLITGNQLGALLVDYVFSSRAELGTLPPRPAFIKTIVTTELQRRIAENLGAACYDTLTGFKHIAGLIRDFEQQEDGPNYVIGGEESYGYMIGTEVRDKDAVSATVLTVEMALFHVSQGKSVLQRLEEIYSEYGYFQEETISEYFSGQQGQETMQAMMKNLREAPPKVFGEITVKKVKDYKNGTSFDWASGRTNQDIDLPRSNVLQYFLEDGSIVSARPSGTEPKIKFYASCCDDDELPLPEAKKRVAEKLEMVRIEVQGWIQEAKATAGE